MAKSEMNSLLPAGMTKDDFIKQQAAYYNGILNIPQETMKYAGLGANWIGEKLGLRTPEEAAIAANRIKQFSDNPPFLPEKVNEYRDWIKRENPEMNSLGNIIGSSLIGSPVSKVNLVKNGVNTVPAGYVAKFSPKAGASATVNETAVQPYLTR